MTKIGFGWGIPRSPADGSDPAQFCAQIMTVLGAVQGQFDSAWMTDHFVAPPPLKAPEIASLECWTTICYLANAFPRLDFGTAVMAQSFRNPALLAKMGATLQLLTSGRFILGLGAGWLPADYDAYGYEYPLAAARIKQLAEAVQIIRQLWQETPASFAGQYYRIHEALCEPKPSPAPPIMIGGGGEQLTLRVVAQYADWWNLPLSRLEVVQQKQAVLRAHCQAVGRDFESIRQTWIGSVAIAPTAAQAQKIAEASPYYRAGWHTIMGNPDQVAQQLQAYVDIGISYLILAFQDFPDPAGPTLFANEVMPQLR